MPVIFTWSFKQQILWLLHSNECVNISGVLKAAKAHTMCFIKLKPFNYNTGTEAL